MKQILATTRSEKAPESKKVKFCIDCLSECAENTEVCPICNGVKFSSTRMEAELMNELAESRKRSLASVSTTGGASASSIDSLLKRVFIFLEDGKWSDANQYCEKVLDIDPECAEAYLGKLMVELRTKKRKALVTLEKTFEDNDNYKKALRFGSPALKAELVEYIKQIKYKNEQARLEQLYVQATHSMRDAKTAEEYTEAGNAFIPIKAYKDSAVLFEKCLRLAEKAKKDAFEKAYSEAVSAMETSETEYDYQYAAELFNAINEYKDSAVLSKKCYELGKEARKKDEKARRKKLIIKISIGASLLVSLLLIIFVAIPFANLAKGNYAVYIKIYGITEYKIPYGVTSIANEEFDGCSSLRSLTIPDSVTNIGDSAFTNCKNLKSVTIPNSVTSIGDFAFSNCPSLTDITIPDSVTSIGKYAFYGCSNLENINIPNSVTSIDKFTFYGCSNLESINFPSSLTSIGEKAFQGCSNLENINIPSSVTSIGEKAFQGCNNIMNITLPNSLMNISENAFVGCSNIQNATIPDFAISYFPEDSIKNVVLTSGSIINNNMFSGCKNITSITLPDSIVSIGEDAFRECTNLTSITIPNSVKSIGASAFRDCKNLTTITIPNSITSIDDWTFAGSGLTSITIPDGVTSIGKKALSWCYNLTSVTIPNSVTYIDHDIIYVCPVLQNIYYTGTEEEWKKIDVSYFYNPDLKNVNIVYNYVPEK